MRNLLTLNKEVLVKCGANQAIVYNALWHHPKPWFYAEGRKYKHLKYTEIQKVVPWMSVTQIRWSLLGLIDQGVIDKQDFSNFSTGFFYGVDEDATN